jgi:hypothetical protein
MASALKIAARLQTIPAVSLFVPTWKESLGELQIIFFAEHLVSVKCCRPCRHVFLCLQANALMIRKLPIHTVNHKSTLADEVTKQKFQITECIIKQEIKKSEALVSNHYLLPL